MITMKEVKAKILLVEDNEERAGKIKEWLRHDKIRVVHTRSGQAALYSIANDSYHLILLDHHLDENHPLGKEQAITGKAIARHLCLSTRNRRARIIIHSMSSAGRAEMLQLLEANGFDVDIAPITTWTTQFAEELVEELIAELEDE